ncbi:MAG: dihydrofolate reductase [Lentisphaerae bacterium]|nr:dihydrofolate reductase [Lentisphaerota bacterium]
MISIICAMGRNRGIGVGNRLPWRLPEDLKRFKRLTMGHTLVMGRKTFESIGRPLPGRRNIVISRNPGFRAAGCDMAASLQEALSAAGPGEVFVIGGAEVYRSALPLAQRLYLTLVEDEPAADTFFPEYEGFDRVVSREEAEIGGFRVKHLVLERGG